MADEVPPLCEASTEQRITALQDEVDRLRAELTFVRAKAADDVAAIMAAAQHRARNMLAVARAILTRSAHADRSVEEFVAHLKGRIDTLVRLQGVLTRSSTGQMDLEELVREEFVAQGGLVANDVIVEGPSVMLAGKAAEMLGLAFHELAANSVKFGALSAETGRIEVRWSVTCAQLSIAWAESGVSIPLDAALQGFGREIIEDGLPYQVGAETSFELRPDGFVCTISSPSIATRRFRTLDPRSCSGKSGREREPDAAAPAQQPGDPFCRRSTDDPITAQWAPPASGSVGAVW